MPLSSQALTAELSWLTSVIHEFRPCVYTFDAMTTSLSYRIMLPDRFTIATDRSRDS